jgi:hypothetical protein
MDATQTKARAERVQVIERFKCRSCGRDSFSDGGRGFCCAGEAAASEARRVNEARDNVRYALVTLSGASPKDWRARSAVQSMLNTLAALGCRICGRSFSPRDIREISVCRNHSICFLGGCLTESVARGWFPTPDSAWEEHEQK